MEQLFNLSELNMVSEVILVYKNKVKPSESGKSTQIDPHRPKQTNPHRPFQIDPLIPA